MNWSEGERLYGLLPAIHRIRDSAAGEPLRALLSVIESELEAIEGDIDGLYDNWFIETCAAWVIPYIGDLVANRPLYDVAKPLRADVANTVSYRRRKATVPMLAELTRDVTGWETRVVEFFQLLAWTQNVNHVRCSPSPNPIPFDGTPSLKPDPADGRKVIERLNPAAVNRVGTVNFCNHDLLDRIDGPFDEAAHTIDVRPPCLTRDRCNIRKVGIYLWRLQSYEMENVTPASSSKAVEDGTTFGYHFSPLGGDAPLFNRPQLKAGQTRVNEASVSGPLRTLALHLDMERRRTATAAGTAARDSDYAGDERAVEVRLGKTPVPPEKIVVLDLETWHRPPATLRYPLADGTVQEFEVTVGIDPNRGRLVFAKGSEPDQDVKPLTVTYHFGFSADPGSGPYRRDLDGEVGDGAEPTWSKTISVRLGTAQPGDDIDRPRADFDDLAAALNDWAALPAGTRRTAVLTILDNGTYKISNNVVLATGEKLVLQAASGRRPTIRLLDGGTPGAELVLERTPGDEGDGGSLLLSGLLIEGGVRVVGPLRELEVIHCTLVPGRQLDEAGHPVNRDAPSVVVSPRDNTRLDVTIDHSITGSLRLPNDVRSLAVRDSIVVGLTDGHPAATRPSISQDNAGMVPGPTTMLERVTIFGSVNVRQLTLASEVIFNHRVIVERRQSGCVRFSFVPPDSVTPRRYRCQPDMAVQLKGSAAAAQVVPDYTSSRYGDPAFAQLRRACPLEIRAGAEDGSEMGVFARLKQPQREANLRQRLDEYLPLGLEAALVFVT